ncbi:MAG: hypothetical protein ACJ746_30795 [Bryobacteraceae bacterium]
MIPQLRQRFNARWSPDQYDVFLRNLAARAGTTVPFRCSETPVFLPPDLLARTIRYGRELYQQLASNPEYRKASDAAIPDEFRVPNEPEHPLFVQADFGLIRDRDGSLQPKLVEIQGFPSIYALQFAMAEAYRETYKLDELADAPLSHLLEGGTEQSFSEIMKRAIVDQHEPGEVVLLEIDPYEQKTLPDFLLTKRMLGIRIASLTDVERKGRQLYLDGKLIRRIYNRVIADELVSKKTQAPFDFREDLDVEWAGHPNWFFRLSKFSLPWFKHPSVPNTWFLDKLPALPGDLSQFVLKPLFSFAGQGVVIGPTEAEIDAIPDAQQRNYILQERLDFVPTVNTPAGPTKVEVRIMYIHDRGEMRAVTTVIRTGRGKMMGVDFNKNLDWVGASAGFFPPSP